MVLTLSLMPVRTAIPNLFVTAHRTGLSTRSIVGDQAALAEIVRRPTMRSRFCSWFCRVCVAVSALVVFLGGTFRFLSRLRGRYV